MAVRIEPVARTIERERVVTRIDDAPQGLAARWSALAPYLQSLLRMAAAFMFILAGTTKLFGFPAGGPRGGEAPPFLSQIWFAGVLEAFGGALLLFGLFTRPVAFIVAGEMAVAYFQVHSPQNFWPVLNGGVSAALYCFIWFYFSAAGAGPWSLDALRNSGRTLTTTTTSIGGR